MALPNVETLYRDRLRRWSPDAVNAQIDADYQAALTRYADFTPAQLDARLDELSKEWSFERAMFAQGGVVGLSGLLLAATQNRGWLGMTAFSLTSMILFALIGWCPPVVGPPRRLKLRTEAEIHREIMALKALRGDFESVYA